MKSKKEYLSIKPQPIKLSRTAGPAAATAIFATAALLAVFLFPGRAGAQDIRQFAAPRFACQFYKGQQGFTIVRDLEHDCLVRNGDNQTGFLYTHYFDSGNNFCLEVTGPQGRIVAPQCVPISQTGRGEEQRQQERAESKPAKIITPPAFHIRELQYDTLPTGKPVQTGDNERIEIEMPDGSLIQLDANATFTPVSDHEVQSVFGRYRYLWQPFHDGKCIVGQNLVRQECRKVRTRDAILGDRGTEFLVATDKSGTTVTVLDGTVIATDLAGKKTVEVAAGQSTFVKHGGLPEDPKSYDPAKIERWWEKKTAEQNLVYFLKIAGIVLGAIIIIIIVIKIIAAIIRLLISLVKKIFRRKKPAHEAEPKAEEKNKF